MGTDRWIASPALMEAGNPDGWRGLMHDFNLAKNNQAVRATGRAAASTKTEKEVALQRCGTTKG
jgi:hypothetical protein